MKPNRRGVAFLKAAVTLLLLHVLYARIDGGALAARLGNLRWSWIAVFWTLLVVNTALSTLKWRMLLAADGIRQRFSSLFASYWIGSFFNVFLPSTIGGDAYRIADVGRRSARTARTAASVMADRLSGFLALALYGLCLFPSFRRTYSADPRLLLLPAAAMAGLLLLGFILWEGAWLRRSARHLPAAIRPQAERVLGALLDSIRATTGRRPVLAGDRKSVV